MVGSGNTDAASSTIGSVITEDSSDATGVDNTGANTAHLEIFDNQALRNTDIFSRRDTRTDG